MALKAINRYTVSYASVLQMTGLSTLKARRDKRSDTFAAKCLTGRFAAWFPAKNKNWQDHEAPTPIQRGLCKN